jgi:catechol 2,3-dioxygenase-like lactoylglutathione lyase family enzyme
VCDVEASEKWYSRVFGLTRLFVEPHDNDTGYAVVMHRPGTDLHIGLDYHADADHQPFNERRTGLDHLAIRVDSRDAVDEWAAHLDRLGVPHAPIHEVKEPMPFALVVFRDPDQIQLEVIWFGA